MSVKNDLLSFNYVKFNLRNHPFIQSNYVFYIYQIRDPNACMHILELQILIKLVMSSRDGKRTRVKKSRNRTEK